MLSNSYAFHAHTNLHPQVDELEDVHPLFMKWMNRQSLEDDFEFRLWDLLCQAAPPKVNYNKLWK